MAEKIPRAGWEFKHLPSCQLFLNLESYRQEHFPTPSNSRDSFETRPFPSCRVIPFTCDESVPGQQQNDQHLGRSLGYTEEIVKDLTRKG